MRTLWLMAFVAGTGFRICGGDENADAPPPAPPQVSAPAEAHADVKVAPEAKKARHGGTVVVAQDHVVEVVPTPDGHVYAYVAGSDGVVPPPSDVQLTVNVNVREGGVRPVHMVWNPTLLRFEGQVVGAVPAPGPADVLLVVDGHPRRAHANRVVVIPTARVRIVAQGAPPGAVVWMHVPPGHVRARGDVPPGRRYVREDDDEAQAEVHVRGPRPPRVRVEVTPPPPPHVRIDIHGPPPPRIEAHGSVRVEGHAGFKAKGKRH